MSRNWPRIAAHSMTIGGKHTFTDWGMVPAEIPVFSPPIPKTNYLDIPASNGSIDYTEVLTEKVYYQNRTGNFSFIVLDSGTWASTYSTVLNFLQGKRLNCILDDDTAYFYTGRFWVNEWKSSRQHSTIVIDYNVEPYKQSISNTTGSIDWLWNDLFNTTIYYGTFAVNGSKTRTLINPSGDNVTPKFVCSAQMLVNFSGQNFILEAGETTSPGFSLAPGNNVLSFTGMGTVLVDYALGKIL